MCREVDTECELAGGERECERRVERGEAGEHWPCHLRRHRGGSVLEDVVGGVGLLSFGLTIVLHLLLYDVFDSCLPSIAVILPSLLLLLPGPRLAGRQLDLSGRVVTCALLQQLLDVAGVHQALDAQHLGGLNERQKVLGRDRSFSSVHEGKQVLHHLVGHVRDVDDGMASAAGGGRGETPPEEQLSEVGGTGGQHQPVGLEDFAAGAADGDIVQRVLACLGGTEDSEEAGQRGLIVVPGEMKLGGFAAWAAPALTAHLL